MSVAGFRPCSPFCSVRNGVGQGLTFCLHAEQEHREPSHNEGGGPRRQRAHKSDPEQNSSEGRGYDTGDPRHTARPSHAGGADLRRVELGRPRVQRAPGAQGEDAHQHRGGEKPPETRYNGEDKGEDAARYEVKPQSVTSAYLLDQVRSGEETRQLGQGEEERVLVRLKRRETLLNKGLGQPREDTVIGEGDTEPCDPQHQGRAAQAGPPQLGDGRTFLPLVGNQILFRGGSSVCPRYAGQYLFCLVGPSGDRQVVRRLRDAAPDPQHQDCRQRRGREQRPQAKARYDEPRKPSGYDRADGPEALEQDQVPPPVLAGQELSVEREIKRECSAEAEPRQEPQHREPLPARREGGQQAEYGEEKNRHLEAQPPAYLVRDGTPEPGTHQHPGEGCGCDQAALGWRYAELADNGREREPQQEYLSTVRCPRHPANAQ